MRKIILIIIMIIIVICPKNIVYADDETDEDIFSKQELDQILETAVKIENTPNINARHAIVYERTSRKNFVW